MSDLIHRGSLRSDAPLQSLIQPSRSGGFSAADQHTRHVRLLKWLILAIIVSAAVIFGGFVWLNLNSSPAPPIDVAGPVVSEDHLTMELPHMSGFNGQN